MEFLHESDVVNPDSAARILVSVEQMLSDKLQEMTVGPPETRYQQSGKVCVFPVDFQGRTYYDCIPYSGRFWCRDGNQNWDECQI